MLTRQGLRRYRRGQGWLWLVGMAPWLVMGLVVTVFQARTALAADEVQTEIVEGRIDRGSMTLSEWKGLTLEELERYEELMAGMRGRWSPRADPITVLGAHARSAQERRRLAELFVAAEYERVEGELAFERAVQAAWKRLYPGQPRVAMGKATELVARYAVVVDRAWLEGGALVRRIAGRGAPVDVYVVGAADEGDLRAWVSEAEIAVQDVVGGRMTINHGEGAVPGPAPAVWRKDLEGAWEQVE